ncbi:hypothetical protein LCGC14_2964160, partial [marine sediment metagenome]
KLPLDTWAKLMGVNPLHFNGVYTESNPPAVCEQPWLQFAWQTADRVGREELSRAILQAEADIERHLKYRLIPTWEEEEWHETIRPLRRELFNLTNTDIRGFAQTVKANWGHFISGGMRTPAILSDGLGTAVTYTDIDGDGYKEVATVTVTVAAGQDPCELRVYFPVSNVMVAADLQNFFAAWEIRPIDVTVTGTTAVISFRREQAVKPELQLDVVPPADDSHLRGVDGNTDANFITTVDVYRVYNDPQTQVNLLWEGLGIGCDNCLGGCNLCEYSTQAGCLSVRGDLKLSQVAYRPATWNAATEAFDTVALAVSRQPDNVRLWYYAGLRDPSSLRCSINEMSGDWARTVAYYAAAILDRQVCACENIRSDIE